MFVLCSRFIATIYCSEYLSSSGYLIGPSPKTMLNLKKKKISLPEVISKLIVLDSDICRYIKNKSLLGDLLFRN